MLARLTDLGYYLILLRSSTRFLGEPSKWIQPRILGSATLVGLPTIICAKLTPLRQLDFVNTCVEECRSSWKVADCGGPLELRGSSQEDIIILAPRSETTGLYRLDDWSLSAVAVVHGHVYHSFTSRYSGDTSSSSVYCLDGQSLASHRRVHVYHSIKIVGRNEHRCFATDARRAHATTGGENWQQKTPQHWTSSQSTSAGTAETSVDSNKVVEVYTCGSMQMQGVPTPQQKGYDVSTIQLQSSLVRSQGTQKSQRAVRNAG